MHRDWEAKNSILLTWQISFDHIRRIRQSAVDLLSLMSFLTGRESQRMFRTYRTSSSPEAAAKSSSEEDPDGSSESDLDHDFEDNIATLRDIHSFILVKIA